MTINHTYHRARHIERLATPGIAPGPRIRQRRRIRWHRVWDAIALTVLVTAFLGIIVAAAMLAVLGGTP